MTSDESRDTDRDASDGPGSMPAEPRTFGRAEDGAEVQGPEPARRPPPYLRAALEAAQAARARAAEVRARYPNGLAAPARQQAPVVPSHDDGRAGQEREAGLGASVPPSRPEVPGPRFAPRPGNGGGGRSRPTAMAHGLFSGRGRRSRLRLALFCLIGLLSGGVAGAALGAFHFLIFGEEPVAPQVAVAGSHADGMEPRGDEVEGQGPVREDGRSGIEVLSSLPIADARTPEPAVTSSKAAAARDANVEAERSDIAEVTPAPAPVLKWVVLDAGPPADAGAGPPPEPVPAKPVPEADLAGLPLPSPPAPREAALAPEVLAALEAGPEAWSDLYQSARALEDEGRLEEAISAYKAAVAADPGHAATFYDLGYAQQKAGRLKAAIASYRSALERNPKHAHAHYNLGYLLQRQGSLGAAVASYRQAAVLDQDNPYVFYNWGEILDEQGDIEGAIDLYKRASELAPDGPPGRDAKARLDRLQEKGAG
jgi:tetratricopeptide (TPR) repeat protein